MNRRPQDHSGNSLSPRQRKLDFADMNGWQRLPRPVQQACRRALARLLYQVITSTEQEHDNERSDPTATS